MKIVIKIKSGLDRHVKIELHLMNGLESLDVFDFVEEHQLSEKLLPSIDEMLKKNKLRTDDIEEMSLISDVDESFTTYRIAKSVVNAFNFSKNVA